MTLPDGQQIEMWPHWFLYLLAPVLVGVLLTEYKNDIFRILRSLAEYESEFDANFDIVVFIPSARNNYDQRAAIRETWFGHIASNSSLNKRVLVKFVIGKEACQVPPEDRLDENSCAEWKVDLSGADTHENSTAIEEIPKTSHSDQLTYGVQSLTFKVLHPVVLTRLGIFKSSIGSKAKVKLLEGITQREIVSAIFSKESCGIEIGHFCFRSVQPYFLPKGFVGTIVGENMVSGSGVLPFEAWKIDISTSRNNISGVLQFIEEDVLPDGHYYDLRRWKSRGIDIVSFQIQVEEVELLKQHIANKPARQTKWEAKCVEENNRLLEEATRSSDLLFVDVIDVYRNIPVKFIHFAQWIVENVEFRYLLKTDDDCFVDIDRIVDRLSQLDFNSMKKTWFGRFRHNWVVERHGKWAERSYPAMVYPKFACGSGYVLSNDLVHWIARNANELKPYQGEDVSMGIWLSAVGPTYIDEPLWQCEKDCLSDMYAEPQLRPDELRHIWKSRQLCGDPCGCN